MKNILEIKNLTKYYKDVCAVKNLSIELKEGEIFGFIGPNGAGKSTTIRAIMNLINKTSGEVYFQGTLLTKDNIKIKEDIGYLPSEVNLYEELTVKEMFDYHASFYKKDLSKRRKELVKKLNIDESKKIEDLSLGNKKKVSIVLALMHEPKLLILDEPTSGLDPIMQQVFYDILQEEKEKTTTIFYSTHILNEIAKICDRVGIIKDGKLLKVESVKGLQEKNFNNITIVSNDIQDIIKELNIKTTTTEEMGIKFKSTIDINQLINILSKYEISKLLIEEPTIEDIFLHYYK